MNTNQSASRPLMSSVLDNLDALEARLSNVHELQGAADAARHNAQNTASSVHFSPSKESKHNLESLSLLKASSGSSLMQRQNARGSGGVAATASSSQQSQAAHTTSAQTYATAEPMRESLFLGSTFHARSTGMHEPDATEFTARAAAAELHGTSYEAQPDGSAFEQDAAPREVPSSSATPFSYSPSRADVTAAHADLAPAAASAVHAASAYSKWPAAKRQPFYTQADDDALNRTLDAWAASDGTVDRGAAAQAATGVSRQAHSSVRGASAQPAHVLTAKSDVDMLYNGVSLRDSPPSSYTMGGASPPPPPAAFLGKPPSPQGAETEGKAATGVEFTHENGASSFALSHRTLPAGMASAGDTGRYRATVAAAMAGTLSAQLRGAEDESRLQLALKARDALDATRVATRQKLAVSGDATSRVGHWSPARQQAAGEVGGRLQGASDAARAAEASNTRVSAALEEGAWRTGGAAAPEGWALDTALSRTQEDIAAAGAAAARPPSSAQRLASSGAPPSVAGAALVLGQQYTDETGQQRSAAPLALSDSIHGMAAGEGMAASMASEAYITQTQLATLRRAHVLGAATRAIPREEVAPHIAANKPPTPTGSQGSDRSFFREQDAGTFSSSRRGQGSPSASQGAHSPGAIADLTNTLHGLFSSAPFTYRRGAASRESASGAAGLWVTPRDAPVGMDREAMTAAFPHAASHGAWRGQETHMGPGARAGRGAVGGLSAPVGGSMPGLDAQAAQQREALAQRAADEAAAARANAAAAAKQAAEAARVRAAQLASAKVKQRAPAAVRGTSRGRSATVAVGACKAPRTAKTKQRSGSIGAGGAGMTPLDHMTDFAKLARKAPGAAAGVDIADAQGVAKPRAPATKPPTGTARSPSPKKGAVPASVKPPPPSVPRAGFAGGAASGSGSGSVSSSKFYATSVRLGADRYATTGAPQSNNAREPTGGTLALSDSSDSDTDSTATMSSGEDSGSPRQRDDTRDSLFEDAKSRQRSDVSTVDSGLVARAAGVVAAPARGRASRRASATITATRAVNKRALAELSASKPRSAADIIRRKRLQASMDAQAAVAKADASAQQRPAARSQQQQQQQQRDVKREHHDASGLSSTQAAQLGSLMHLVGAHVDERGVPSDGRLPPAADTTSAAQLLGQGGEAPEHFLPPFTPTGDSVADTLAMSRGTHSSLRALAQAARSELQAHNDYAQRQEHIKGLYKKKAELLASCGYPQLALRVLRGEEVPLPKELLQGGAQATPAAEGDAAGTSDVSLRGKQVGKFYAVPSFPEYNSTGVEVDTQPQRQQQQQRDADGGEEALARAVLFGDGGGDMQTSAQAELMAAGGALHAEVHDRSVWMQATFSTGERTEGLRHQGLFEDEQKQLDAAQRYKLTNVVVPDAYFSQDADAAGGEGADKGRGHPMFGLAAKDMPPPPPPKSPKPKERSSPAVVPFGAPEGDSVGGLPGGGNRFTPPVSPTGRGGKRWSVPPQMLAAHDQRMAQAYAAAEGQRAGGAVPGIGQAGFSLDRSDLEHLGISGGGLSGGGEQQRPRSRKEEEGHQQAQAGDAPKAIEQPSARPQLQLPEAQQGAKPGPATPSRPASRVAAGDSGTAGATAAAPTPPKPAPSDSNTVAPSGDSPAAPAPKAKRTTPPKPVSPAQRAVPHPAAGGAPHTPPRGGPVAARPAAGGAPRTPPRGGPVAARPAAGGAPRTPPRGGPVAARPAAGGAPRTPPRGGPVAARPAAGGAPRTPPRGGPVAARPAAGGAPRTPPRGGPVAARPAAGGAPRTPPRGGPVAARPAVSKAPSALQLDDDNWL